MGDYEQSVLDPEDFSVNIEARLGKGKADFTGREIIEASLYEKCYHLEVKNMISKGVKDMYDLETLFIDRMVDRLGNCEDVFGETGVFKRTCLF